MARTAYDPLKWQQLLDLFRGHPGNIPLVARMAGIGYDAARSAWSRGWVSKKNPEMCTPIRDILTDEKTKAEQNRIAATLADARREDEERIRAREDAIRARSDEGKMVALARTAVMGLAAAGTRCGTVAHEIAKELEDQVRGGKLVGAPIRDLRLMLTACREVVRDAAHTARVMLEAQRVMNGEPLEVVAIRLDELKSEDIKKELEGLHALLYANANAALAKEAAAGNAPQEGKDKPS